VTKDLERGIEGRDVVIVEDIVDTGLTLSCLQGMLRARGPRSLRTACLLDKRSRRTTDVTIDYVGFVIQDRFVVGYGLDLEHYRQLPYIATIVTEPIDLVRTTTPPPARGRRHGCRIRAVR
jgi:hypoxanthine phosphoribosyltransferase